MTLGFKTTVRPALLLTAAAAWVLCGAVSAHAQDAGDVPPPPAGDAAQHDHSDHAGHDHPPPVVVPGQTPPVAKLPTGSPQPITPGTPELTQKVITNTPGVPMPTVTLAPGEAPAIEFDTPTYQFGRVQSGGEIRHDFWFTNTGTGPLEVLAVRPSCGCTAAGAHDRVVRPGESGKIPIQLSTGKFSGAISKSITVHTNAPGLPMTTLMISGEVWQIVDVLPPSASFGKITGDSNQTVKLTIVNNSDQLAALTNVRSSHPAFRAETRELEPGKKFEVSVTAVPPFNTGTTSGSITIDTGITEVPTINVPVYAFMPATVEVIPPRLHVPAPPIRMEMRREVYVRHNVKAPLKITDLAVSNPALKAELSEQVAGSTFKIAITIPTDYTAPPTGDKLTFKTDSPTMPNVEVPIFQAPAVRYNVAKPVSPAASDGGAGTTPAAPGTPQVVPVPAGAATDSPASSGASSDRPDNPPKR